LVAKGVGSLPNVFRGIISRIAPRSRGFTMPSPFPGMDPFLEKHEWNDFHSTFNTVVREKLSPKVSPSYLVRVERRVYVEHTYGEEQLRQADVAIVTNDAPRHASAATTSVVASATPVEGLVAMAEEIR